MAVPKKRTSKAKKNIRKANWKRKASQKTEKALSLVFSIVNEKQTSKQTSKRKRLKTFLLNF